MSKSVNEVLDSIAGKKYAKGELVYNRFSKKSFNELLEAMANDVNFKESVVKKANATTCELEDVMVTEGFRQWLKKVVEKLGVDKKDAEIILSPEYTFSNMDGLYEFFMTAVYEYMMVGNKFDLIPHEEFKGTIYLKDVAETVKVTDARNPKDGSHLGTFEIKKKKHKTLAVKSSCPTYLTIKNKLK